MLARLRVLAQKRGDSIAVATNRTAMTFGQLLTCVEELLRYPLEGRTVVSVLPSGPLFTATQLACVAGGATFVPLSQKSTDTELRHAVGLVMPDILVADPSHVDSLRALMNHSPAIASFENGSWSYQEGTAPASWQLDDAAMVQLTSGSTGAPKGVVLTRANLEAGIALAAPFAEGFEGAAVFCPMPQFHAMGNAVALEHLMAGSTVVFGHRLPPGTSRRLAAEYNAELLVASPSYIRLMRKLKLLGRLQSVRAIELGSAPVDPALLEGIREATPKSSVRIRYGLSEAYGMLACLDVTPADSLPEPGAVGTVLPGIELAPLPPHGDSKLGELSVRGPNVATRQLGRRGKVERIVDAKGILKTGDLGQSDQGTIHLRGRKSEFIKRGGFRIDPSEIEQTLVSHPNVDEATVVALPDPLSGSKVVAMVQGRANREDLTKICNRELSSHKVPQEIVLVSQLPRTHSGKPDRQRVRAMLLEGAHC